MARPIRDSDMAQFAVNANSITDDSIDCGVLGMGWCRGPACQKFARLRTFILVLGIAGLLQGACEAYFRVSAKQAALEYDYEPLIVDWLLVTSGLCQAVFALLFAHWSQKFHPIKWLVGALMLQSVTCVVAVIPGIINFAEGVAVQDELLDANLCATTFQQFQRLTLTTQQSRLLTLILLFVLQLALGLGSLAYYVVGITYIDDNSLSVDSPAVIAAALGARVFGQQLGSSVVLGVGAVHMGWWLGWLLLAPVVFVSALLLGLFPRRLPKTVVHQAAQRIIEETQARRFGSQMSTYIDDTDFVPSMRRLLGNKLLMFNLLSVMFVLAAVRNFALQEENYLQSRFYLPFNEQDGLLQEWTAAFVAYFLKPPVMAVGMLVGGLVIAKAQLSARTITGLNIGLALHLALIYVAYVFIKCDVGPIAGVQAGKLDQPMCSSDCLCKPTAFMPVCPENSTVTYFSPCYAGCRSKTSINSVELYGGCSCRSNFTKDDSHSLRATSGACSSANCSRMLLTYQVLSISAAALLGVSIIGRTLITLRSVLPQDKCLALACELMFAGLFAYVPVHLAYDTVSRTTCVYWAPNYARCLLRETPLHGNILDILTASLILCAIVFDVLVYIYAKGLNIYNCKVTDHNYTPALYSPVPHEEQLPSPPAVGGDGSPVTQLTSASPQQRRDMRQAQPATGQQPTATIAKPHTDITVFRNPSSTTTSSAGEQSLVAPNGSDGVTYAQVVFPPDRHKPADGSTSPKRLAVPANVPVHHLSEQDVRAQRGNLKSFGAAAAAAPASNGTKLVIPAAAELAHDTHDTHDPHEARPQSPETDF